MVYGMSYKFMPKHFSPTQVSDPNLRYFEVGSGRSNIAQLSAGPFASEDLRNFKDYKIKGGQDPYVKGFYRIGKYLKGKKIGWLSTNQNGLPNPEDEMKTMLWCVDNLATENVFVGKIAVTYYVAFKNRAYAT